jgi:hypothetical protein
MAVQEPKELWGQLDSSAGTDILIIDSIAYDTFNAEIHVGRRSKIEIHPGIKIVKFKTAVGFPFVVNIDR